MKTKPIHFAVSGARQTECGIILLWQKGTTTSSRHEDISCQRCRKVLAKIQRVAEGKTK